MSAITKTRARAIARRARQHGHSLSGNDLYVFCPLCRERVHGVREAWRQSQPSTMTRELDRVMVEHLLDGECPNVEAGA